MYVFTESSSWDITKRNPELMLSTHKRDHIWVMFKVSPQVNICGCRKIQKNPYQQWKFANHNNSRWSVGTLCPQLSIHISSGAEGTILTRKFSSSCSPWSVAMAGNAAVPNHLWILIQRTGNQTEFLGNLFAQGHHSFVTSAELVQK